MNCIPGHTKASITFLMDRKIMLSQLLLETLFVINALCILPMVLNKSNKGKTEKLGGKSSSVSLLLFRFSYENTTTVFF